MGLDQHPQLALEPVDLTGQAADLRDLLTSDLDPRACGELAKAPSDSVKHPRLVEGAALERAFELGTEFEQVPPQPVDHARARRRDRCGDRTAGGSPSPARPDTRPGSCRPRP